MTLRVGNWFLPPQLTKRQTLHSPKGKLQTTKTERMLQKKNFNKLKFKQVLFERLVKVFGLEKAEKIFKKIAR